MDLSLYTIISFSIILIFSIILSVQDIKKMTVSIYIQWASIFTALVCHMIFNREGMWIYILSSMICGTFYFAVRKITKDKLGPADVWFGFFQGLFLNLQMIPEQHAGRLPDGLDEEILFSLCMQKQLKPA